jgi:sec-independent protein translocase protein TatA
VPFGPKEILLTVLLVVLLFGAKRIPEMMRSLGGGFREFKRGIEGSEDELEDTSKKSSTDSDPKAD